MKIHIFYRHYNSANESINGKEIVATEFKNKNGESFVANFRPEEFSFEKCWINLLQTIENRDDVDIHLIMDGDIDHSFMSKYKDKFTLHLIKAGSDQKSFNKTWEIAKSIKTEDDDIYYFLENDYLHVDYWVDFIKGIYSFREEKLMHYVSLYDHMDKYIMKMYSNLTSSVKFVQYEDNNIRYERHWRSTPSTCGSFCVSKQLFEEDYDVQTTFSGDHEKFLYLNKEKNRGVFTPIPSLSTHCVNYLLAPAVNWNYYNSRTKEYND
tara:strand:- start:2704 stop:3501 length:798 start_codon:yes stop_codon:yes gene_type:complete